MMTLEGIAKLTEEIGELQVELGKLQQVLGKFLAYPEGPHPDGLGDLASRLEDEMADVLAAIYFTRKKLKLDTNRMTNRMLMKEDLFQRWDKEKN